MVLGIIFLTIGVWITTLIKPEGTLYVYSIPQGAEIYIAPEGTLEADAPPGLGPIIGSPESYVGRAPYESKKLEPFKITLKPGHYDVGVKVTAEQIHEALGTNGNIDFEFDGNFVISRTYEPPDDENAKSYLKVYKLQITNGKETHAIALFQPENVSYSRLVNSSLFPPEETFHFDDEDFRNILSSNNAPSSDIPDMLELIHQGGKLIWRDEGHKYILDWMGDGEYGNITVAKITLD